MVDVFNSRELATLIWVSIILGYLLYQGSLKSLKDLFNAALHPKIILPILCMIGYACLTLYLLHQFCLWDLGLLKDAIYWVLFLGLPLIFKFTTSRDRTRLFRTVFVENLKLVVIVEFLVNFYTLPLVFELILMPIIVFISLSGVIANQNTEYIRVKKFLDKLQAGLGIGLFLYVVVQVITNFEGFWTLETLKTFLLPILLTILYLPFLYGLVLYANYESLFTRLEMGAEKSRNLKWKARKEIFKQCLLSVRKTDKAQNMTIFNLMGIRNEEDIQEMSEIYRNSL